LSRKALLFQKIADVLVRKVLRFQVILFLGSQGFFI